jgi:hypothetical protein
MGRWTEYWDILQEVSSFSISGSLPSMGRVGEGAAASFPAHSLSAQLLSPPRYPKYFHPKLDSEIESLETLES